MNIPSIVAAQRAFFRSGVTLDLSYRRRALDKLERAIKNRQSDILAALRADLGKSDTEGYLCEIGMALSELSEMKRGMGRWAATRTAPTPLGLFPAKSMTVQEPYGVVLVMSPWNYPFLLAIDPLIGAIAAGNCCVIKPSAYAPVTSALLSDLLSSCFPPEYVTVIQGGREENQSLLDQKFDYIFFTGGVEVGRQVMEKAAKHLTPVTLELGGKSPCIVDKSANLDLAAKRLAFGKLLNCGQTCVAPDYLLIDRSVKDQFLPRLKYWMATMYGQDPLDNQGYVHMINRKHFDRVKNLIDPEKVCWGGKSDETTLRIQPTVLDGVTPDDPVMQEEIFGPVLPVLTFDHIQEAEEFILDRPRPLALYLFSRSKTVQNRFLKRVPFGGGCINDTIMHLANPNLPFGGIGNSGMGAYHGKKSFDTFSHTKGVVKSSHRIDLPIRYAPYTRIQEKLIRQFLK